MKAFLMHGDRDFDAQMVLARREGESHRRRHDPGTPLQPLLPWNETALREDLGLDVLLAAMADGDSFLFEVAQVALLSPATDLDTIYYRQRVYLDCASHEPVIRRLYQIAIEAIEQERKNYWSSFGRYPSRTLSRAVEVMQIFVGMLKELRAVAEQEGSTFGSGGFRRLFAMLRRELTDDYFAEIERHLANLRFRGGVLISAGLGEGNRGTGYVLRRPHRDQRPLIDRLLSPQPRGLTFRLHPRDENGARALSELRDRGINLVADALAQSCDHILSFFAMLRTELAFYIGCLNLKKRLRDLGQTVCLPSPAPLGTELLSATGLYDPTLALNVGRPVIANDLDADGRRLLVITGANTGGKSTFMRSVGLAQLMTQAGMFVAAQQLTGEIRTALITHYKREEDAAMESGKLDEELSRMSEIIDRLSPGAMLLLNESFAATNEREGSEIADQIVQALLESGIKICFVTHLYSLADSLHQRRMGNTLFLRAERQVDGQRTFRIIEGAPQRTSYGKDVYDLVFSA